MATTAASSLVPIITSRKLAKLSPLQKPLQAWVETLSQSEDKKLGLIDLHPSIFGVSPRLDILARNVYWQSLYGKIVRIKKKQQQIFLLLFRKN